MDTKCYVVMAYEEYEGSEPIKAFLNKDAANEFRDECNDYHLTRPADFEGEMYVDIENSDDVSTEFEEWQSILDEWRDNHPAGINAIYVDKFIVIELPFDDD